MPCVARLIASWVLPVTGARGEPARGAYVSANVQFLPAFVTLEKSFYRRAGLDVEMVLVRNAVTSVQALIGKKINFIFSVGPQMPSIWEGSDIVCSFSMVATPDIQKVTDLKGKNFGVSLPARLRRHKGSPGTF